MDFRTAPLWKKSLGKRRSDPESQARERLRVSFELFRNRAGVLANAIAHTYPSLTVHDLTHLDALWDVASVICGDAYPLTPAEAFVLGGGFLVHDLGNGAAAYLGGTKKLRESDAYRNTLAVIYRAKHGRMPTESEIASPDDDTAQEALETTLRQLHAQQATEIMEVEWQLGENRFRLLQDDEVRDYLGRAIGSVATSHWWYVHELEHRLQPTILNAPPWLPAGWSVDLIKVAGILRVADAAHLDARRAPPFLRAVQKPRPESEKHWLFQERLGRPAVRGDRLAFTASRPFTANERDAWWLCHDMLKLLDGEIRAVTDLFANTTHRDHRREPLVVQGVLGVENPNDLARHVTVSGWTPIDARVHVTDVRGLVERLGGYALYGRDPLVPIRELVQNAADAVRARRALDPKFTGQIRVRRKSSESGETIEVQDDGVGMSQRVLVDTLLDFSCSLWSSERLLYEHPTLAATTFAPTGKFGIGFFSVFMASDTVQVCTQRYDEGPRDSRVLEFTGGLRTRPFLRPATSKDAFGGPGTRVSIQVPKPSIDNFRETLIKLIPSLDVSVSVADLDQIESPALVGDDWLTIPDAHLASRCAEWPGSKPLPLMTVVTARDGKVVGRAAIAPGHTGVLTVGGLRASWLPGIAGVLLGTTERADRKSAVPLATRDELSAWATEQARLWKRMPEARQFEAAPLIRAFGGDLDTIKFARHNDRFLDYLELVKLVRDWEDFLVLEGEHDEVLDLFGYSENRLQSTLTFSSPLGGLHDPFSRCFAAVCELAWGVESEDVLDASAIDVEDSLDGLDIHYSLFRKPGD